MNFDQELKITERILKEIMDYPKEYFELPEEEFDKLYPNNPYIGLMPVTRQRDMFVVFHEIEKKGWKPLLEESLKEVTAKRYNIPFDSPFSVFAPLMVYHEDDVSAVVLMLDKMQEVSGKVEKN